jgi:DUF4097 and DUF4098 domain-containing protein YvlB
MREQTIPYSGQLSLDGGRNGGVTVKGWSRGDVLVRAKVEASAPSDSEARGVAGQIRLRAGAGTVASDGPASSEDRNWAVSYEVFVPRQSNLQITTENGGVHVADINGRVDFSAVNGGVHLTRVNGHVQGKTTNGGVHIELAGSRWEGDGLDVSTTNGGVHLEVPANYSARLETSTVNGSVHNTVPMTVSGKIGRQLSANLGSGGATIRLVTTNGGVHFQEI